MKIKIGMIITLFMFLLSSLATAGLSNASPQFEKYMKELQAAAAKEVPGFKGFSAERGKELYFKKYK